MVDAAYWVTVAVVSIHVLVIASFWGASETIQPPEPLMMSVSMITQPAPKLDQIEKPQPPVVKSESKPEPKPVVKKPPVKTAVKPQAKPLQPLEEKAVESPSPAAETPAAAPPVAVATAAVAPSPTAPTLTPPDFRANYASNPRPVYPTIARNHGWQGKVSLRVHVTVEGLAASVHVERSSGHEVLDDAAIEAVKQWRFIPAKHGDTPVASSVVVPLNFSLQEEA